MARYVPSALLQIAKPCGESWEAMAGDSRVRHCASCGRDVINAAALNPEQIERHIKAALNGGSMPCMRLVQFEDGALLTARSEQRLGFLQRAISVLSVVTIAATTAAAQVSSADDATLTGRIIDATGEGVSGASVKLQQPNHADVAVKTAADGTFRLEAVPGEYALSADGIGFQHFAMQRVILHKGIQDLAQPLKLELEPLMGEIVVVKKPLKTRKPKKTSNAASAVSLQ